MTDPLRLAVSGVEASGPADESDELTLEDLEPADGVLDLARPTLQEVEHMGARRVAAIAEGDCSANLSKREPDGLRGPDERQPVKGRVIELSVSGRCSRRWVEEADVAVVANGLDRNPGSFGQLTDAHHPTLASLTLHCAGGFTVVE